MTTNNPNLESERDREYRLAAQALSEGTIINKPQREYYSPNELRDLFIDGCITISTYWSHKEDISAKQRCDGVISDILEMIDGRSSIFPDAINLAMRKDPERHQMWIIEGEKHSIKGQVINLNASLESLYLKKRNE